MARDTGWTMSQENVEIVRAFFEAALDDPDAGGQDYLADDVEFIPFTRIAGPSQGAVGFMRRIADISDQFEDYQVRPERLQAVGDLVVADLRREARSKRGPGVISDRFAQVFTLRDGKIARIKSVPSFADALKAAELSG
jgi:ketosteroid isomerase-like protein